MGPEPPPVSNAYDVFTDAASIFEIGLPLVSCVVDFCVDPDFTINFSSFIIGPAIDADQFCPNSFRSLEFRHGGPGRDGGSAQGALAQCADLDLGPLKTGPLLSAFQCLSDYLRQHLAHAQCWETIKNETMPGQIKLDLFILVVGFCMAGPTAAGPFDSSMVRGGINGTISPAKTANADTYPDAVRAIDQGDDATALRILRLLAENLALTPGLISASCMLMAGALRETWRRR